MDLKSKRPRYGIAELYVDRPGEEVKLRVSKKKKILQASDFIINDDNGVDGRLTMAKILGKRMSGQSDADVEDFLLQVAEKDPDKIIKLYTGGDLNLRILLVDAREAGIIFVRDKNYWYSDKILGGTDDAAITWMKNPKNKKILELIRRDTYPHLYPDTIDEPQGKDKTK